MKFLSLDYIKKHSRIDLDEEDDLLEMYGEAAEDTVLNLLNRSYEDVMETYGDVPKPLMQAALMLVDVGYNHRAPVSPSSINDVPYTFALLLKPYIRLVSKTNEISLNNGCKNL